MMEILLSGIKGIHGEVPTTPGRCSSGKRRDMILRNIMIIDVCLQLKFKYLPKNTPRLRDVGKKNGKMWELAIISAKNIGLFCNFFCVLQIFAAHFSVAQ